MSLTVNAVAGAPGALGEEKREAPPAGDEADGLPPQAPEADDEILRPVGVDLEELAGVEQRPARPRAVAPRGDDEAALGNLLRRGFHLVRGS